MACNGKQVVLGNLQHLQECVSIKYDCAMTISGSFWPGFTDRA